MIYVHSYQNSKRVLYQIVITALHKILAWELWQLANPLKFIRHITYSAARVQEIISVINHQSTLHQFSCSSDSTKVFSCQHFVLHGTYVAILLRMWVQNPPATWTEFVHIILNLMYKIQSHAYTYITMWNVLFLYMYTYVATYHDSDRIMHVTLYHDSINAVCYHINYDLLWNSLYSLLVHCLFLVPYNGNFPFTLHSYV